MFVSLSLSPLCFHDRYMLEQRPIKTMNSSQLDCKWAENNWNHDHFGNSLTSSSQYEAAQDSRWLQMAGQPLYVNWPNPWPSPIKSLPKTVCCCCCDKRCVDNWNLSHVPRGDRSPRGSTMLVSRGDVPHHSPLMNNTWLNRVKGENWGRNLQKFRLKNLSLTSKDNSIATVFYWSRVNSSKLNLTQYLHANLFCQVEWSCQLLWFLSHKIELNSKCSCHKCTQHVTAPFSINKQIKPFVLQI